MRTKIRQFWMGTLPAWIAYRLPRRVAMWAYLRVHSHASITKYHYKHIDEVTYTQALLCWRDQ